MSPSYSFDDTTEQLMIVNDPKVTRLNVVPSNPRLPNLAFRLGHALHKSTHIDTLHLDLASFVDEEKDSSVFPILHWITSTSTLKNILIKRSTGSRNSRCWKIHDWFQEALSNRGLHSLSPLKEISIWNAEVWARTFIRTLEVCQPECLSLFNANITSQNDAVEHVRNAISTNTSLRTLDITIPEKPESVDYFCAILEALPSVVRIREVLIRPQGNSGRATVSPRALDAIVSHLQKHGNHLDKIRALGFRFTKNSGTWDSAIDRLRPFQIESLSFQDCDFDEGSSLQLLSVFESQGKHRLNVLRLDPQARFPDSVSVMERLAGASPGLATLSLCRSDATLSQNVMNAVLAGLMSTSSELQEIQFGRLRPAECSVLLDAIPSFRKLHRLQFEMREDSTLLKKKLLKAAKLNGSMKQYTIMWPSLMEEDRGRLRQYLTRNSYLRGALMTHTATTKSEDRSNTRAAVFAIVPDLLYALVEATSTADGIAQVLPCLMRCGVRIGRYRKGQVKRDRDEPSNHQDEEPPREAKRPRRSNRFASKANDGDETGK